MNLHRIFIVNQRGYEMAEGTVTSLEDLKLENAAKEEKLEPTPQVDEDEPGVEAVDETEEVAPEDAESEDGETKESDTEDWMKSDDSHESQEAEKKYTGTDIGKAKQKLKAKLNRKHDSETEQLKARIAELEQVTPKTDELSKPKREDFYDNEDPDEAFFDAKAEYNNQKFQAKQQAEQISHDEKARQQQINVETDQAVDQHYERAIKLAEDSGITAEAYQGADYQVRQMVDSIFPGSGDVVTDAFISKLGKGSEKVMYSLGVNKERREVFKKLLLDDTSGIAAGMYLGELKKDLVAPSKRKTAAPPPIATLKGDAKQVESSGALQKKYDDAHKKGDFGKAFKLKQAAKDGGANTSNW